MTQVGMEKIEPIEIEHSSCISEIAENAAEEGGYCKDRCMDAVIPKYFGEQIVFIRKRVIPP